MRAALSPSAPARSLPRAFAALALIPALALGAGLARADEATGSVAAAAPAASAAPRVIIVHVPPQASTVGEPIELAARIDAPFAEQLSVRWRALGAPGWHDAAFERSTAGGWYATLPPPPSPGLEYYLRGVDASGAEVLHFASPQAPQVVRVDPTLYDRLEALDLRRLDGRRDQVSFDVMGHNFGNRYGQPDRFFRGELAFTHRFLGVFHHVSFGFGSIAGKTPRSSTPAAHDDGYLNRGLRYGYGEVRLRIDPSVFLDARLALGVSHDGFDQAGRGVLTVGRPWRSSVSIGGEAIGDLGTSAWARLQSDSVSPLLMGASVVRTNLPGVEISSAGLYVAYDVTYRFAERFTLRGQLSYGPRDGSSHVGGGLGTAVDF
jgi:hypothetical protein